MAMLNNQRVYTMIPPKTRMYTKVAKRNHGDGKIRKKQSTKFGDSKMGMLVPITSSCFSQGVFHESLPTKKWYFTFKLAGNEVFDPPSLLPLIAQLPGCELHPPHQTSSQLNNLSTETICWMVSNGDPSWLIWTVWQTSDILGSHDYGNPHRSMAISGT